MGDFLHLSNTAAELNQSVRVSALLTVGGAGGGQDYPALTYNHPHPDQFIQTHYSHYTPLG